MADGDVGNVSFGINAEFDDKGFKDAEKALSGLGKSAAGAQGGLTMLGTAGAVTAGIIGADVVKAFGKAIAQVAAFGFAAAESGSKATEAMNTLAEQTGIALQDFQRLEPVFRRTGVSMEAMGTTFRILAQKINESKDPSSQAAQSFSQLGLVMTGLESPSQVFALIADRISKLPPGFERTRLQTELLGRSGSQLTGILSQGAEGFLKAGAAAQQMGNVLSTASNNALLALNSSFKDLEQSFDTFDKHVAVLFAPMVKGFNESKTAALGLATVMTDDLTVASRTLSVRFQAMFGFLKEQAQLGLTDIMKVPEIFQRWNDWATAQISIIRSLGVTNQDLAGTIGTVDEQQQKLARSQAAAAVAATNGLIQLDLGWKQAQAAIDLYDKTQKATFEDGIKLSKAFADQGLSSAKEAIDGELALQAAYQATVEAGLKAKQVAGSMTPMQFSSASANESVAAVERQIEATKKLQEAQATAYQKATASLDLQIVKVNELAATAIARGANAAATEQKRAEEVMKLTTDQIILNERMTADKAKGTAQLAVLDQQRVATAIEGSSRVTAAVIQEGSAYTAALQSIADSELRIAQASFQDTSTLRALRLQQINLSEQAELSMVGRTEQQKTAIMRKHEADRMAIAQQFPSFYQKQLQDLVASNVFSMSQITTSFTNATAQWIVTGTNFKAFWQQLQVSLVQAGLNALIQMGANFALKMLEQTGITTAMEEAKTAATSAGEAARLAMVKATNIAIAASMAGVLAGVVGMANAMMAIAAAVVETVVAILGASAAAFAVIPGGQPIAGGIIVAAASLEFEAGAAIGAGTAAIEASAGAAVAAFSGAAAFAKGGINLGGPAIFGEAGPEAAIPLNDRGAEFMMRAMSLIGTGGSGQQKPANYTIIVEMDKQPILKAVANGLPSMLRLKGLPA